MSSARYDSPYADDPAPSAGSSRETARPRPAARPDGRRPAGRGAADREARQRAERTTPTGPADRERPPEVRPGRRAERAPAERERAGERSAEPRRGAERQPASARAATPAPTRAAIARPPAERTRAASAIAVEPAPVGRRRGRRSRGAGGEPPVQLTSHPTGRAAYQETRAWLLGRHGPVCAYCDRRFTERVMTLDHVAPRRGQSAYDRRDNLVLACPGCNAAKRDLAPLAFLLGSRDRAANLLRYGSHLSAGLLDLARSLVPDAPGPVSARPPVAPHDWSAAPMIEFEDGDSPYAD